MNRYENFFRKKLIVLLICLTTAFATASCGKDDGSVAYIEDAGIKTESPSVQPIQTDIPEISPTPSPTPAPTIEPSQAPVDAPVLSFIPASDGKTETSITEVSVTTPARRRYDATISIKAEPDTEYTLQVFYPSGESKAAGLGAKVSDSEGNVSWTWKIGATTTIGTHYAIITGNGENLRVEFEVTE